MTNYWSNEPGAKQQRRRRKAKIDALGGKCGVCGTTRNLQLKYNDARTERTVLCKKHCNEATLAQYRRKIPETTHGSWTYWGFWHCKCEICVAAARKYRTERAAQLKAKNETPP